jgi:hypothetical protein
MYFYEMTAVLMDDKFISQRRNIRRISIMTRIRSTIANSIPGKPTLEINVKTS